MHANATRTIRRAGTKTKVLHNHTAKKGPFPKSRNPRTWKKGGAYQRVAGNPRFL